MQAKKLAWSFGLAGHHYDDQPNWVTYKCLEYAGEKN